MSDRTFTPYVSSKKHNFTYTKKIEKGSYGGAVIYYLGKKVKTESGEIKILTIAHEILAYPLTRGYIARDTVAFMLLRMKRQLKQDEQVLMKTK